jgi:DNA anti-recombination protein RmuC
LPPAVARASLGEVASAESPDVPTRTAVLEQRVDATDRTLESLRRDMNQGFADFRREMNQRFDHMNDRMDQMNGRLDQHLRRVITTVITTAFAIIGANVGILTLLLRGR